MKIPASTSRLESPSDSTTTRPLLVSLSLPVFLAALATSIGNVGLPALAGAFAAPFAQVQWVVLGYLLALTSLVVAAGKLGDAAGHRRLLLTGLALFSIGALLGGAAPTLGWLIGSRVLQGMGAALMMALSMAIASSHAPSTRTGSVMGLLGTMSAMGTALGPAFGGFLISAFGWRALFLVNVPLGVIAFLRIRRLMPADTPAAASTWARFDYGGAGLLVIALVAYSLAFTKGSADGAFSPGALLLTAIVATILLIAIELKKTEPLVSPHFFRDAGFSATLLANALVSAVLMSTLVVGPFHFSRGLALEPGAVGLALAVGPVVAALMAFPAGRVVDRVGADAMSKAGLAAIGLGAFTVAMLPARFGLPGYLGCIVAITAGYAVFQSANNTAAMSRICPDERGVGAGLLNLSRNLGLITGVSAMGTIFARATGTSDIATAVPAAVQHGMQVTYAVAGGLILGALAMILISQFYVTANSRDRADGTRKCEERRGPASHAWREASVTHK